MVEQWLESIRALWPECPARISSDGQTILLKHAPASSARRLWRSRMKRGWASCSREDEIPPRVFAPYIGEERRPFRVGLAAVTCVRLQSWHCDAFDGKHSTNRCWTGLSSSSNESRRAAARAVNSFVNVHLWVVGRRIVEEKQRGRRKADYCEQLVEQLAADLTARFGKEFSRSNVFQMRQFSLAFREIVQTPSEESPRIATVQTVRAAAVGPRPLRRGVRTFTFPIDEPLPYRPAAA